MTTIAHEARKNLNRFTDGTSFYTRVGYEFVKGATLTYIK